MTTSVTHHQQFIQECYRLARQAGAQGNHPFGAVLVFQAEIILTAENTIQTDQDVTRHAELNLVSQACRQFSPEILHAATLYTSTEPCAMCTGAIYWAGIRAVVYGCSAQDLASVVGADFLNPCAELFSTGQHPTTVIGGILFITFINYRRHYLQRLYCKS